MGRNKRAWQQAPLLKKDGDINDSFSAKDPIVDPDIFVIEDSEDSFSKKKVTRQTILENINHLDFNTSYTPGTEPEARVWWNGTEYTLNLSTGIGPVLQVGQEQYILMYNSSTTDTIPNGTVMRPLTATVVGGIVVPVFEYAQANIWSKAEGTIAIATSDITPETVGFVTRFGRVRNLDLSAFSPGDTLYLSEATPGALTNVRPSFPDYNISLGGVLNNDNTDGEFFVSITNDIYDTILNAWDGGIRETINFYVDSDGATITGSLSSSDGLDDLTLIFSDGFSSFDVSTPATVVLTAGSADIPQTNYVYIDESTKTLQASTSDWPVAEEHIRVAQIAVRTAAITETDGALRNQNWNDHIKKVNDNGHLLHIAERLRQDNSKWDSGTEGSAVIGGGNEVWIKTTAGVVYQLHRQAWPLQDMTEYVIDAVSQGSKTFTISGDGDLSAIFPDTRLFQVHNSTGNDGIYTVVSTVWSDPDFIITVSETIPSAVADGTIGDDIHIVNDSVSPYDTLTDLGDVTLDASGNALNNTSYSIVVWGVMNKTGQESHLMANLPTATYNKNFPIQAVEDAFNYSVYSIPKTFQGVGFLIARFTFVNSGGTWSLYDTEDLRGSIPNTTAGGGAGGTGVTTFLGLTDTPSAYTSQALNIARINAGETALEFLDITTDWLTQYLLLLGRSGGQSIIGGTASGDDLSLESTSNATKGYVTISDSVGIGETTPLGKLHVKTSDTGGSPHGNADDFIVEVNTTGGATILTPNNASGVIFFADPQFSAAAQLQYSHGGKVITLGTIESGGIVNIATAVNTVAIAIDASQNSVFSGTVKPTNYLSSDGTAGITTTSVFNGVSSGDTLTQTFKNGILVGETTVP